MPLESPFSSLHKAIPRHFPRFSRFKLKIVTIQVKKSKKVNGDNCLAIYSEIFSIFALSRRNTFLSN